MFNRVSVRLLGFIYLFLALFGLVSAETISSAKSDNPLMFMSKEEMELASVSAPPMSEFRVETNETVVYDSKTQTEIVINDYLQGNFLQDNVLQGNYRQYSYFKEKDFEASHVFEPFKGLLNLSSPVLSQKVLGADGRARIRNTTAYPWRTIAKLIMNFPDGKKSNCSGAIIDNFHVLTAAHCIYSRAHGGYANIKVYLGQDGNYTPFYYANSSLIRSYTQWTINRDPNHDWALITLDRNIGLFTGWMGLKVASRSSSIYKGGLNVSGYPNDQLKGTLWNDYDKGHSATEYRHFYFMDTYGGQSGSPVWGEIGGKRYILSIHGYGDTAATPGVTNGGTRINTEKYNKIQQWRALDRSPTDKPDLIDDGNTYSGFSPASVSAGKSLSAYSDVRNIGTANSGGFYVSYYASKDTTITSSDYYLGRVWVSSITPFAKADANWKGSLSAGIPAGSYYLGWIIDSTKLRKEFIETNNTGYKSTPKLTVTSLTSSVATLLSPNGTITDNTPKYSWKAVSGATYYQLWVNDSKGQKIKRWYKATVAGCRNGTGTCSITPTTKLATGNGSWKIRVWSNRKYGSWSAAKSFKVTATSGGATGTATLISPSGTIKDNTPKYSWKAVSGATYYQLWVNDSKGQKIKRWYKATVAGCRNGTGTCSITPTTKLATGNGTWKIRVWGNRKYGLWSAAKSFKVTATSGGVTGSAILISPSGTIKDNTPKYSWKAVSGATYYQLWVNDSKGQKIKRWYKATVAGCRNGTGTCSITPTTKLASGNGTWKIRTWGNRKYGSWSAAKNFKVSIAESKTGTAILISPSGAITDSTPRYTWKAVAGASYYQLWVNDSRGNRIKTWYSATALGCQSGKGNCSITPLTSLNNGNGMWKVRAWANRKYGLWSASKYFIVSRKWWHWW